MNPRFLLLAAALLLNGCALFGDGPAPTPVAWTLRQTQLEPLTHFALSGRLSSSAASGTANLIWRQNGDSFTARLSGPLGLGTLILSGTPDAVEIRRGKERLQTQDPEGYLFTQLGWSLPLVNLRHWVRGLPATGDSPALWDEFGRLAVLTNDGWTVQYVEYRNVGELELPRRMTLQKSELTVTLIVDEWTELAPAASAP